MVSPGIRERLVWMALVGASAACVLSIALRVGGPSDGARVAFYAGSWSADGVQIEPIDPPADGLQRGDTVRSVAGRSIEAWAADVLDGGVARPAAGAAYEIERDGATQSASVAWSRPRVGATLVEGWSVAVVSAATALLAAWVFRRRRDTPAATALVLAASGIAGSSVPWFLGVTVSDLVRATPFVVTALVTGPLYMVLWPAAIHLALTFPTPATVTRRHRWLIPAVYGATLGTYGILTIATALTTASRLVWIGSWPITQVTIIVPSIAVAVAVFVVRYLRTADPVDRARSRLATLGMAGSASLGLVTFMGPTLLVGRPLVPESAIGLISMPVPVALAWAIVHDRLFEIDVAIRRTLLYGGLTVGVLGAYLVAVTGLTALLGPQEYAVSLLATGAAALVALPLRDGLQRAVDRLLYGQRDQPVLVMRRLALRLEGAADPARAFPAVVDTMAEALRLPYVALEVTDESGRPRVVAEHGDRRDATQAVALVHGGEPVGRLVLGLRFGETAFDETETALFQDLGRQVGAAVHAQRLRDDLARSRERLVVAREEERRRLRRDLHDGLGPTLASMAMHAEAAAVVMTARPDAARRDLQAVSEGARSAIADLRRLVDGLRPPSLDQLGLVGAIRDQADRLTDQGATGPRIAVEVRPDPLPELPAAVEVAAFRIVVEAVTNVVRHAGARTCHVRLIAAERLSIEVADDGRGLPPGRRSGTGLESMRERAEEVGGALVIQAVQHGTIIRADLPLRLVAGP